MSHLAAPNSGLPGLKQFRQEGCISYLFFDPVSGEAALIDPRTDLLNDYREAVAERKLKPVVVIDTRVHWHHLSGSHLLAEAYGIPIAMSAQTESARATRRLAHGDRIQVGRRDLSVLATPGVSQDAICLWGAGLLLSGDTLLIGAPARTDLPGGDNAALWHSLREVLDALPPKTIVLPGSDQQELIFSTLEIERRKNPDFLKRDLPAFVVAKLEERSARSEGEARHRIEYNLKAHPAESSESHFGAGLPPLGKSGSESRGVAAINVEKYALKIKSPAPGDRSLDVREPAEFAQGHIPGTINIPVSEVPLHLEQLASYKRIYVSCQSGRRSHTIARTLDYLGLGDVINVSGGFKAWENAGLPIA